MAEKQNNLPVDGAQGALKGAASRQALLAMVFSGLLLTGAALLFLNQSKGYISEQAGSTNKTPIAHTLAQSFSLKGVPESKIKYSRTFESPHKLDLPHIVTKVELEHRVQAAQAQLKQVEEELRVDREQSVREYAVQAERLSRQQRRLFRQNQQALALAHADLARLKKLAKKAHVKRDVHSSPIQLVSQHPQSETLRESLAQPSFVFGDTVFSFSEAEPKPEAGFHEATLSAPASAENVSSGLSKIKKPKIKRLIATHSSKTPEKGFVLVSDTHESPHTAQGERSLQDRLLEAQGRVSSLEAQQDKLSQASYDASPQFYARQARQYHLQQSLTQLKNDLQALAMDNDAASVNPSEPKPVEQPPASIPATTESLIETPSSVESPIKQIVKKTSHQRAKPVLKVVQIKPIEHLTDLILPIPPTQSSIVRLPAQKQTATLKIPGKLPSGALLPAVEIENPPQPTQPKKQKARPPMVTGAHFKGWNPNQHAMIDETKESQNQDLWPLGLFALLGLGYFIFTLGKGRKANRRFIEATLPSVFQCFLPWIPEHQWKYHRERQRLEVTTELIPEFNAALETLAQSLQAERLEGGERVLLACSLQHDGGQPSLLANLALCLAENGGRVLLIDTNLQHPQLHEMFQQSLDYDRSLPELLNWLAEKCLTQSPDQWETLLDQKLHQFITSSGINDNLAYLNAGCCVPDSLEFSKDEGLGAIIQAAKTRYDWVILTSPPALSQQPDLQALSRWVEGLLVFVERGSKRGRIQEAAKTFASLDRSTVATIIRQQ